MVCLCVYNQELWCPTTYVYVETDHLCLFPSILAFGWNLMCLWISVSVCLWFCDTTVLQFEGYPYASGCTKSLSWIDSGGKGSVKIL